jgi:hypothetical protein
MRMARLKAAINQCRDGDLSALLEIEIAQSALITISAFAKAADDAFTYGLTQRLLAARSKDL